jgi:hypothetical protein
MMTFLLRENLLDALQGYLAQCYKDVALFVCEWKRERGVSCV